MFLVQRPNWLDPLGYQIRFAIRSNGRTAIAENVQMREVKDGEPSPDVAMLRFESGHGAEAALQSLFNQLWELGFRPSDVGTAGHLEATKAHLEDMRSLVGKSYGVDFSK